MKAAVTDAGDSQRLPLARWLRWTGLGPLHQERQRVLLTGSVSAVALGALPLLLLLVVPDSAAASRWWVRAGVAAGAAALVLGGLLGLQLHRRRREVLAALDGYRVVPIVFWSVLRPSLRRALEMTGVSLAPQRQGTWIERQLTVLGPPLEVLERWVVIHPALDGPRCTATVYRLHHSDSGLPALYLLLGPLPEAKRGVRTALERAVLKELRALIGPHARR